MSPSVNVRTERWTFVRHERTVHCTSTRACCRASWANDDPLATASYGYILPMIWPTPLSIKSPNRKQFDQRVGILERFFSALTCAAAARRCSGCGNQRWRQSGRAAASCRGSTTPPRCQCRSRTGACTAGVSFCYRAATTMCCCTSTAYSTYAVHVHVLRTPQKTYV